jgi:hypothetical protein
MPWGSDCPKDASKRADVVIRQVAQQQSGDYWPDKYKSCLFTNEAMGSELRKAAVPRRETAA